MSLATLQKTGFRAETMDNIVVDAGAIYTVTAAVDGGISEDTADWSLLGATQDGATFNIDQSFRTIDIDGIKGEAKGAPVLESVAPMITANLLEFNTDNIQKALPGATVADWQDTAATHDILTRSGCIEAADYIDYVALVGRLATDCAAGSAGEPVVFLVKNGLSKSGFSFDMADESEAVMSVEFSGHYDPDTPTEEPWAILIPKP
jgi:hypothetical protein